MAAARPQRGLNDDRCWSAVAARDRSADGCFYYAVTTTGIYCRPSCGSRRPRRENVRFFASPAEASGAGFRPCKRCRPDSPTHARQTALVAAACRAIETADEPPTLAALARAAGLSPGHFHRLFKAAVGMTPKGYAVAGRCRRVRERLRDTPTVTEAIHAAGFGSSGRFYAGADRALGMTPTAFRKGGAMTSLRFAVGPCSLGQVLVAASEKGVAAVLLGDDPDALLRDLQDRFPNARLIGGDRAFEEIAAGVIAFVERPAAPPELPLDIRGTAFQHRVWQALTEIPAGTTTTYAAIAQRLGRPKAARAVAGACAANPLAVIIPCHRVVKSDGKLSGYRWGIARKRSLLDRETRAKTRR
ncbi:MAG: bifunctional DNA-binding transcriptional regulator/O6-methylguanine-DNA methyltransferase Ada [Pseudomonadota bacterium]